MAILTVGPSQQFSSLRSAVAVANDGDTITIMAGNYVDDIPDQLVKTLTITGVGGFAHLSSSRPIANGKGLLIVGAGNTSTSIVTLNNLELSGAVVADNNGSGIRYQGGHLTVNNCYLHNNQNGIMGGDSSTSGSIAINRSEFYANGFGDGYTHNIYVRASSLSLNNVYGHATKVGHEVKSRCASTTISNSRFQNESGDASYCLDFPNGGHVTVSRSVIQKSATASNSTCMVAFGEEGVTMPSSLSLSGNSLINNCANLHEAIWNADPHTLAVIEGNRCFNASPLISGNGSVTNNIILTSPPALDLGHVGVAVSKSTILALCDQLQTQLASNSQESATLSVIISDIKRL